MSSNLIACLVLVSIIFIGYFTNKYNNKKKGF